MSGALAGCARPEEGSQGRPQAARRGSLDGPGGGQRIMEQGARQGFLNAFPAVCWREARTPGARLPGHQCPLPNDAHGPDALDDRGLPPRPRLEGLRDIVGVLFDADPANTADLYGVAFELHGATLSGPTPRPIGQHAYATSYRAAVQAVERLDRALGRQPEIEPPSRSLGRSLQFPASPCVPGVAVSVAGRCTTIRA